jgi:rhodanese-related sulfurtransferase
MGLCYAERDESQCSEDGHVLYRLYARCIRVFWHEEIADLNRRFRQSLRMTHRQEMHWQVGFLFSGPKETNPVNVPEIQAEDLKHRLDKGENLFLLDVRDEYEYEISNIGGHLIPLPELPKRLNELNERQEIVTLCKMGPRGVKAVELLQRHGFQKVSNLRGGIHAWSDRVDRRVRKY